MVARLSKISKIDFFAGSMGWNVWITPQKRFTHTPRPCTHRATFAAMGANARLPLGWRPKGITAGKAV